MLAIQFQNSAVQSIDSGYPTKNIPQYPVLPSYDRKRALKEGFKPTEFDVLCTRGNGVKNHPGNIRLLQIIKENLNAYATASSKLEKSLIVSSIIDSIRSSSPDGGFIKQEKGRWYEVGDHHARERVGQKLRDLLSNKYASSSGAKKRRRRADEDVLIQKLDKVIVNNGLNMSDRFESFISTKGSDATEDDLQAMFNKANMDLLQKIKEQNLCDAVSNSTVTSSRATNSKNKRKFEDSDDDESSISDSSFDPIPFNYCSI